MSGDDRAALAEEGMRLLAFLTAAADHDVRVSVRFITE
jgi:hypothetical protein